MSNQAVVNSTSSSSPEEKKIPLLDGAWGEYMGDAVYGALDGTVTTFAVIAGAIGAQLSISTIIILGLANLFADGFSMSMGNYLSQRSQRQFLEREKVLITALLEEHPQTVTKMLEGIYRRKGFTASLVDQIVSAILPQPAVVQQEVLAEKKVITSSISPLRSALVTFAAFVAVGFLPVLPILVLPNVNFWLVLCLVATVLFIVGSLRSKITAVSWWQGGLEIMIAGLFASLIAFAVGDILSSFFV